MDRLDVVYTGPDMSFSAPSELLSGLVRCCLYRAGQVILLRHPDFYIDRLDVIYTGPDRLFTASSELFYIDRVDVIYTGLDWSFSAPSGLLSGSVRYCLYRAGQVIYYAIRTFIVDYYKD